jgi:hypothetical protein
MMHSQPSALELVEAVAAFLEERALPELQGRTAFHARIAVNVLAIVKRELEQGGGAHESELSRLRDLLGGVEHDADHSTPDPVMALNRELCRRIRNGEIDAANPELIEHLWRTTLAQLAIDQPKYAAYKRIASK